MHYKFDFGVEPEKYYTGDNIKRVLADTLYSDSLGYGLSAVTSGCSRSHEDAYLRDFLYMKGVTFKVKLPNGKYNVRVYTGDFDDRGDIAVGIVIQGKKAGGAWVSENTVKSVLAVVVVEDETMEFEFAARNYVCINAIEIAEFTDEPPVNLNCAACVRGENGEVTLSWDKSPNVAGYVVYIYNPETDITLKREAAENSYIHYDAEIWAKYIYNVRSVDKYGFESKSGAEAQAYVTDGQRLPDKPSGLIVTAIDEKSVSIKWNKVDGAVDYIVYQKAKNGGYKKLAVVKGSDEQIGYADNNVITAVEFIYAVAARTTSGFTEKAEVRTPVCRTPFKRRMEKLDRGLVVVAADGGMFLSWRLAAYEYKDGVCFNIYKNGAKLNAELLAGATNYFDAEGVCTDIYTVKAVLNGKEEDNASSALVFDKAYLSIPVDKPAPCTLPDGQVRNYTINDISVADLDGDGEYELVLKWDCGGKDNSHSGYSGTALIDAYKLNGTKLWRIDLGINIRCGAHYTQFLVYDFDGDGKAEMILKTADGTTDSKGNVIGDKNADYRNSEGFILEGPEFLSVFNGETGELLDTVPYDPPRGNVADWGDSWGNRVDRFLACVAYLDGENPSAVMCRGYYDRGKPTNLAAYDLVDKKLVKRWKFRADTNHNIEYTNQGNHNIAVGDADGDGRDEIIYGACAIDHDGTGMYSTRLGHGDALHFGKFDPSTEGFDFMQIHEHGSCPYGLEVRNPGTGEVLWGKYTGMDTARGLMAKIDPRYQGDQVWAYNCPGIYTYKGEKISEVQMTTANFAVWWDGDLLRELLDHKWLGPEIAKGIGQIYKWDWINEKLDVILDAVDSYSINHTKGNPCIQADIFGDWREEIIWRNEDDTELRVYTTTHPTEHRIYTLMHDPVYRLSVAFQNTAYNQPPHTGFYIGPDMLEIPVPDCEYEKK